MNLTAWRTVNRRCFEPRSGPSKDEWQDLIKSGAVRGKILGDKPFVDLDHLAAETVFTKSESQQLRNDIPNLLD